MEARNERTAEALKSMLEFLCPAKAGITEELIKRCGSAAGVINSGRHTLMREGLSGNDALIASMLPDIARHMERAKLGEHPRLCDFDSVRNFLRLRYLGSTSECFFLLPLDENGRLIELIRLASGAEASAPFNIRQILSETVRTGASALIITHNHPDGTERPSDADIECTLRLMNALQPLNAPLIDHIIMPDKNGVSMRLKGYIGETLFLRQSGNKLLREYR